MKASKTTSRRYAVLQLIFGDFCFFLLALSIAILTWSVIRFYQNVSRYPKGPFPYPFIANLFHILSCTNKNRNVNYHLCEVGKKYGGVYTLWIFHWWPMVFITDPELHREAFQNRSYHFNGRYTPIFRQLVTEGHGNDIVFEDHGPAWASLRRVALSAVRKFVVSKKLAQHVNKAVENAVDEIKAKEGFNKPFDITQYLSLMFINIFASTALGKSYSINDEEFVQLAKTFNELRTGFDVIGVAQAMPEWMAPIFIRLFAKPSLEGFKKLAKHCRVKFDEHLLDYQDNVIRDFADSLIESKKEAIADGKESIVHLTDHNLGNVIIDLFFAGIDTSQHVTEWIFLLMAKYPSMQMKMREEIKSVIGDRIPVQDDKNNCHFVMAFITETLRLRTMPLFGVPHTTTKDTEIGRHKIPAHTIVCGHLFAMLNNSDHWINHQEVNPYRFLDDDGKIINIKSPAFVPFGAGRRICVGEKLAVVDMFLVVVRTLQLTDGWIIALPDGPDSASLDLYPPTTFVASPMPFKLIITRK